MQTPGRLCRAFCVPGVVWHVRSAHIVTNEKGLFDG